MMTFVKIKKCMKRVLPFPFNFSISIEIVLFSLLFQQKHLRKNSIIKPLKLQFFNQFFFKPFILVTYQTFRPRRINKGLPLNFQTTKNPLTSQWKSVGYLYWLLLYPNFWSENPTNTHRSTLTDLWFSVENSAERYFKIPHFGSESGSLLSIFIFLNLI